MQRWKVALVASFAFLLGLSAVIVPDLRASEDDWTTEYILVRENTSTATLDTSTDVLAVLGRPSTAEIFEIHTGLMGGNALMPMCGSICANSSCDDSGDLSDDTNFGAASTYYGSFVIALSTTNGRPARVPLNMYMKTNQPNPGKKMVSLSELGDEHAEYKCYEPYDNGASIETWTFRKYSLTMY